MKNKIIFLVLFIIVYLCSFIILFKNKILKKYSNSDFNIETYISSVDMDMDGIDDQTDILNGALSYVSTKPKYKSKYYDTGYSNDSYGVCTDVVANAMKTAGYDLMKLVNVDIINNREF